MSWFRRILNSVFDEYQSKHPSYQFRKPNLNIGMFRRLFVAVKDGVKTALHALRVWAQQQPHTFKLILAVFAVGGVLAVVGFAPGVIAAGSAAAAWLGTVSKGLLFAVLQSLAATAVVCVVGACIREILSVIISWWKESAV